MKTILLIALASVSLSASPSAADRSEAKCCADTANCASCEACPACDACASCEACPACDGTGESCDSACCE